MARKVNPTPLALLLLSGSQLLLWFVILSGITSSPPLQQTYFLRADTSGIRGARPVSQWTYFAVCGLDNADCGPTRPALPLGDAWAGGADNGAPAALVGSHGGGTTSYSYWYMWRFGWVFYLLALLMEVLAWFVAWVALFSSAAAMLTGALATVGLVFLTVAVSLMTANFVKMRNVFEGEGRAAQVGAYAFGFSWGSWTALLLATVLFFLGARRRNDADVAVAAATPRKRWTPPWKKTAAVPEGRRVKDEYA